MIAKTTKLMGNGLTTPQPTADQPPVHLSWVNKTLEVQEKLPALSVEYSC